VTACKQVEVFPCKVQSRLVQQYFGPPGHPITGETHTAPPGAPQQMVPAPHVTAPQWITPFESQ